MERTIDLCRCYCCIGIRRLQGNFCVESTIGNVLKLHFEFFLFGYLNNCEIYLFLFELQAPIRTLSVHLYCVLDFLQWTALILEVLCTRSWIVITNSWVCAAYHLTDFQGNFNSVVLFRLRNEGHVDLQILIRLQYPI